HPYRLGSFHGFTIRGFMEKCTRPWAALIVSGMDMASRITTLPRVAHDTLHKRHDGRHSKR
ncbi:MAG: hypothetical protein JW838_09995, partial [Spirochaetes bacterium]|nr:hypothetical protein [Spirochaetota bacterium]